MDHNGRIQMVFGHGHRLSLKDLDDTVATDALLSEVEAANSLSFTEDESFRTQQHGRVLAALLQKVNLIMADLDALKTADANIQSAVAAAGNELHDLAARLATASQNNDQAGIDAVTSDLQTAATNLTDAVGAATATSVPTPAPETPAPAAVGAADQTAPAADTTQVPGDQAQPAGPVVTDTPPADAPVDPAADNTAQGAAVASDATAAPADPAPTQDAPTA